MIALSGDAIRRLLTAGEAIAAVEAGLREFDAKRVVVPQRHHIEWQGNTYLSMPAVSGSVAGVKLVAVAPKNAELGRPVTNGAMLLLDAVTVEPLALLNAAALTALRTGAVGALGVKYQTPPDASSIGIVGCGVQGTSQAIAACAVRPIRTVYAWRRTAATFDRFAAELRRQVPSIEIVACGDARELLEHTSIVIAATTSSEPVLPDEPALLQRKHFISVGSYRRTMQELPDSVYRLAGALAIDSDGARGEVGDVLNSITRGLVADRNVFPIVELVLGRRAVDVNGATAYKTAGHALFDLCVAEALYRKALASGAGDAFEL